MSIKRRIARSDVEGRKRLRTNAISIDDSLSPEKTALIENRVWDELKQLKHVAALTDSAFKILHETLCIEIAYARAGYKTYKKRPRGLKKLTIEILANVVITSMLNAKLKISRCDDSDYYEIIKICCRASGVPCPDNLDYLTKPDKLFPQHKSEKPEE